jgi:hypothetical protein
MNVMTRAALEVKVGSAEAVVPWHQNRLMAKAAQRHKTFGRRDLAQFVAKVGPARLPWRRMSVAV